LRNNNNINNNNNKNNSEEGVAVLWDYVHEDRRVMANIPQTGSREQSSS
jgi:hypothetical protein